MNKYCIAYGSDVSAGTFQCEDCGETITMASRSNLPPCPNIRTLPHEKRSWKNLINEEDDSNASYPNE